MWASGRVIRFFDVLTDANQSGVDPTGVNAGEVWVTKNWNSLADGHYAQWDGASWTDLGKIGAGDLIVVNGSGRGATGGSFSTEDGQILRYDGGWKRVDSNAAVRHVMTSEDTYFNESLWTWAAKTAWVPGSSGYAPLRVYEQDDAPTLADNQQAIWVDTNDGNRVYLVFYYGRSLYGVEMTAF